MPTEPRHTSEANQRAQPEHVMSADLTYATRNPTYPHGNPSDRCHSVQVRSDLKAKYNPQRLHTHEIVHLLHICMTKRQWTSGKTSYNLKNNNSVISSQNICQHLNFK